MGYVDIAGSLAVARGVIPGCTVSQCAARATWSATLRAWRRGDDPRTRPPLVAFTLGPLCSHHAEAHLRTHIASDAFWNMLTLAIDAARLPPASRESLELEIAGL